MVLKIQPFRRIIMTETWEEAWQAKDKMRSAQEIFNLIQGKVVSWFDPNLRQELSEKDQSAEDIELAIELMACIGAIDKAAFGKRDILLEFFVTQDESNEDLFACYCSPKDNPRESYGVWVGGLYQGITKQLRHEKLILPDCPIKKAPLATKEEFLLGVGVHEVRHRLQYHKRVEMFVSSDTEHFKEPMRKVCRWIRELLSSRKRIEAPTKKDPQRFLAYCDNPDEFDANVVQDFACQRLHQGISLEEFFALVMLEPAAYK